MPRFFIFKLYKIENYLRPAIKSTGLLRKSFIIGIATPTATAITANPTDTRKNILGSTEYHCFFTFLRPCLKKV